MNAPAYVKKQAKAANDLHEQIYKAEQGEPVDQAGVSKAFAADDDSPAKKGEQPAAKAEKPADPPKAEAPSDDAPADPPKAETPAEEPAKEPSPQEVWEQKYRTLQGINRALQDDLTGVRQVLANLRMNEQPGGDQPPAEQKFILDSDVEDYGQDLIDMVKRVTKQEISLLQGQVARLTADNKTLREKLGHASNTAATSGRKTLVAILDEQQPKWRQLNNDQQYLAWLDDVDPFSGHPRRALFNEALEKGDAKRVLTFFNSYLRESSSIETAQEREQSASTQRQPQVDLEEQVGPGRGRGPGAAPAQDGKKMWTKQEIQQFYNDVQRGKYKGRDKERGALERDIIAAGREGRITQPT